MNASLKARKAERGQGLVEYALVLVLVAVVVIGVMAVAGQGVSKVYCTVVGTLNKTSTCASSGGSSTSAAPTSVPTSAPTVTPPPPGSECESTTLEAGGYKLYSYDGTNWNWEGVYVAPFAPNMYTHCPF